MTLMVLSRRSDQFRRAGIIWVEMVTPPLAPLSTNAPLASGDRSCLLTVIMCAWRDEPPFWLFRIDFFFPFRVRARFLGTAVQISSLFVGQEGSGANGTLGVEPSVVGAGSFGSVFHGCQWGVAVLADAGPR